MLGWDTNLRTRAMGGPTSTKTVLGGDESGPLPGCVLSLTEGCSRVLGGSRALVSHLDPPCRRGQPADARRPAAAAPPTTAEPWTPRGPLRPQLPATPTGRGRGLRRQKRGRAEHGAERQCSRPRGAPGLHTTRTCTTHLTWRASPRFIKVFLPSLRLFLVGALAHDTHESLSNTLRP